MIALEVLVFIGGALLLLGLWLVFMHFYMKWK